MSNFYDRYIKRTIGDCKSVKEHNLKELKDDFEEVLNDALTSDEYLYTKVNISYISVITILVRS